ncbi:MAG: hypothetical protein ACI96M_003698 [Candidatus Azotimanducaceae bacterium]|jgi:hypothetical protein
MVEAAGIEPSGETLRGNIERSWLLN